MQEKEIKLKVNSVYKESGMVTKQEESEEIDIARFEDVPLATVSVDKSITKNLGNFNSFKVSAFMSVPVYLNEGEMDRAFDYASKRVESAIINILKSEGLHE